MKKILLLAMLIVSVGTLKAQWSITPEVGMSSSFQINSTDNWYSGWKIGAGVEYELKPECFALKSGLYYTNRRSRHFEQFFDSESEEWGLIESKAKRHFLQVPLMGKFSFRIDDDVRFTVAAGPYFALQIIDSQEWYPAYGYNYGYYPGSSSYNYGYGGYYGNLYTSNDFRNFDWGLTGSIGLEIKNWVINLGYDFALGEEFKYGWDSVGAHYHTLNLTAGYKFSLGK